MSILEQFRSKRNKLQKLLLQAPTHPYANVCYSSAIAAIIAFKVSKATNLSIRVKNYGPHLTAYVLEGPDLAAHAISIINKYLGRRVAFNSESKDALKWNLTVEGKDICIMFPSLRIT